LIGIYTNYFEKIEWDRKIISKVIWINKINYKVPINDYKIYLVPITKINYKYFRDMIAIHTIKKIHASSEIAVSTYIMITIIHSITINETKLCSYVL